MSEFGHIAFTGSNICIDTWGAGPFVISAGGKSYRFGDSDRFGPYLADKHGDPLKNAWPSERCPFWRAHRIWVRQGRRTEDGSICIWEEPKPTVVKHIGGRNYMIVEAGEEDGITLVVVDGGRVPIQAYQRRRAPSPPQGTGGRT